MPEFIVSYPVDLILRDKCPVLKPDQLEANQKLVLRRPQEPSEAKLVYTVIDPGKHLQRLMTNTEPPKIIDVSVSGLAGLCRRTDLLINHALYENLALAQSTANTAMQRFLRSTTK